MAWNLTIVQTDSRPYSNKRAGWNFAQNTKKRADPNESVQGGSLVEIK